MQEQALTKILVKFLLVRLNIRKVLFVLNISEGILKVLSIFGNSTLKFYQKYPFTLFLKMSSHRKMRQTFGNNFN